MKMYNKNKFIIIFLFVILAIILSSCTTNNKTSAPEPTVKTEERKEPTATCNENTLCESNEDTTCNDCTCKGTICGGLCYTTKGTCCNNEHYIFSETALCSTKNIPQGKQCSIPGECTQSNTPLIVEFKMPIMYEVGKQFETTITITNNGEKEIRGTLDWLYNTKFTLESIDDTGTLRNVKDVYTTITLQPSEQQKITVLITPKQSYNLLTSPLEGYSNIWIVHTDSTTKEKTTYYSPVLRIFDSNVKKTIECDGNETGKTIDYLNLCSNGLQLKNSLRYDSLKNTFTIHEDILAIGEKNVYIYGIDTPHTLNIQKAQEWIENFYDKNSMSITGKNLVNFNFVNKGTLNMDWNSIQNNDEFISMIEQKIKKEYDFIILYVEKASSHILLNDSAGTYLGKGIIVIDSNDTRYSTIAHEIAHGFGSPDLYTNTSVPLACTTRFINDLMCGATMIGLSENPNPEEYTFNTAGFIGWGDVDRDEILDVEDTEIVRIPSWSTGIEIYEAIPQIATITEKNKESIKEFSILINIIDKKTKKRVPGHISIQSSIFNMTTFTTTGLMYYSQKIVPEKTTPITVTARIGTFTDTKTVEYNPETYKYTASTYKE